jgi:hypothetical protein
MCSPPNRKALGHGLSQESLHVRIFESPVRSIARSGNCQHMNRNIVMGDSFEEPELPVSFVFGTTGLVVQISWYQGGYI